MNAKREGRTWDQIGSTLRGWVESGVPKNPQDGTLSQLDALRGWEAGSARRVLDGDEPTLLTPKAAQDRARGLVAAIRTLLDDLESTVQDD